MFLIVGGGIAGATAGAELTKLGRVVLWEAEAQCGHHASGRSAAMFEAAYGLPATIALNRASRADHEAAGHMSPRGLMFVGLDGQDDAFDRDVDVFAMTRIAPGEARARLPILSDAVRHAAYHADAWDLDTDAMLQAALRAIRREGAVETGRRIDAIERLPRGWRVRAGGAEIEAEVLVDAAGAWADGVASMAGIAPLGIVPHRRSMARLAAPGGHDVTGWPMVIGAGETWYAKPDAGALIVSPADEDAIAPQDAWADDLVLAEGLARYEAAVTEPVTRPLASWAGLHSFAPDRALVLGPDPADSGFVWCAGQGGYGFQTAPAAARLLADRVAGHPPELDAATIAALSPGRFA